jgi:hypothetical protein
MIIHRPRLGPILHAVGISAGVALATIGLVAQPAAALGGAMVGVFVAGGTVLRIYERPGTDKPERRRGAIGASATAIWLWLIGTGLVVLLGTSTASVLVAVLVIGVPAAVLVLRRFQPVERVRPAVASAEMPSPAAATLSTPELCLAWRRSYLALEDLPPGPDRNELVTLRQSMLDELERRDPAGFGRWLDSGARAGGDPGRYLAADPGA